MFINYNSKNRRVYGEDNMYGGRYLIYPIYGDEIRPAGADHCYFKNGGYKEIKLDNEKEVLQSIKDFFQETSDSAEKYGYLEDAEKYKQKILLLPNHK